jgi:thiol-disulfide isomerase/thioredoxin
MRSRWVWVTVGLLAMILVTTLVVRSGETGDGRANLNFTLKDMNGQDVQLSAFAGKPLVVNLWATWCGPCRLEMPQLVALADQYKEQGLTIVGISIDDSPQQIREFAKEYNVEYPLLVGAGRDDVLAAFGYFGAVPMSVFIAADGRITARVPGVATTAAWERRIQELF